MLWKRSKQGEWLESVYGVGSVVIIYKRAHLEGEVWQRSKKEVVEQSSMHRCGIAVLARGTASAKALGVEFA